MGDTSNITAKMSGGGCIRSNSSSSLCSLSSIGDALSDNISIDSRLSISSIGSLSNINISSDASSTRSCISNSSSIYYIGSCDTSISRSISSDDIISSCRSDTNDNSIIDISYNAINTASSVDTDTDSDDWSIDSCTDCDDIIVKSFHTYDNYNTSGIGTAEIFDPLLVGVYVSSSSSGISTLPIDNDNSNNNLENSDNELNLNL